MLDGYLCSSPRPGSRHATASYKGRQVAVDVTQDVVREGSHIVVVVAGEALSARRQRVEYVTDDAEFDAALSTGFNIACALIDAPRH